MYKAGYFGFWLHDHLPEYGTKCIVTPPSLVPQEYGNHVKTDRRDSRKLAHLLAKGMLKRVWVPTGQWTKTYVENLHRLHFNNHWMQESFERLLEEYEFLSVQIQRQTNVLSELADSLDCQERAKILRSVPGIGLIAAMELLLELQDVERFRRADPLAAYVGLTPSQYSSADKVRMGRITCIGKSSLRATMVEVAWRLIAKDPAMRQKYERIKMRAGSKRAIIAIARMTLLRTRRMLLDHRPYVIGLAA